MTKRTVRCHTQKVNPFHPSIPPDAMPTQSSGNKPRKIKQKRVINSTQNNKTKPNSCTPSINEPDNSTYIKGFEYLEQLIQAHKVLKKSEAVEYAKSCFINKTKLHNIHSWIWYYPRKIARRYPNKHKFEFVNEHLCKLKGYQITKQDITQKNLPEAELKLAGIHPSEANTSLENMEEETTPISGGGEGGGDSFPINDTIQQNNADVFKNAISNESIQDDDELSLFQRELKYKQEDLLRRMEQTEKLFAQRITAMEDQYKGKGRTSPWKWNPQAVRRFLSSEIPRLKESEANLFVEGAIDGWNLLQMWDSVDLVKVFRNQLSYGVLMDIACIVLILRCIFNLRDLNLRGQ